MIIRNKYMRWGIVLLLAGIAFNIVGWFIMDREPEFHHHKVKYGWAMIIGVLLFGAGFLYILYSLIRKVERNALIEERAERIEPE
ncbi:signal peptidase [Hufsiella ginkgonis]|uniref:Signal peptidase n=1 Tax=Hufsiella ginkgonis TaxID=2695274 RepID=A0A7K1Y442_9SPHI|nr:signal peptidase [Hufsiella ginkgonis]MXV17829.1 signal peptidase [Hufsiella ginkgonis]